MHFVQSMNICKNFIASLYLLRQSNRELNSSSVQDFNIVKIR